MRSIDLRKPPALRPGASLAILSPASAAKPDLVEEGIAHLHALGYRTMLGAHALHADPLYYAGSAAGRAADLHAAFADPSIDAILCTRGGWGSAELLPLLDSRLIRACPKPFIGYSDLTSLQLWMLKEADLVTFYGPMVAADFAREGGVDARSWQASLTAVSPWSLGPNDGLRTLCPGFAQGPLTGGCLSIFAESLGTAFAPAPYPGILFLEDIGAKPYQWDRMLLHLRYAGFLDHATGILFGDMEQTVPSDRMDLLEGALRHRLSDFSGPIAIGLRCGHVNGANRTLPLGIEARLDCTDRQHPRLDFLEGAVTL